MKMKGLILCIFLINTFVKGQVIPLEYSSFIIKADSCYYVKDYNGSANYFTLAFAANGGLGKVKDRYNAACSWALANQPDSAFFQLNKIATKGNFRNYQQLLIDSELVSLHNDLRWLPLVVLVKANATKE